MRFTRIDLTQFLKSSLDDSKNTLFDNVFAENIYKLLSQTCVGIENGRPVTVTDIDPSASMFLKSIIEKLKSPLTLTESELNIFLSQLELVATRINSKIGKLSQTLPDYVNFLKDANLFNKVVAQIKTYIDVSYGLGYRARHFKDSATVNTTIPNRQIDQDFTTSNLPRIPSVFPQVFAKSLYNRIGNILGACAYTGEYAELCTKIKEAIESATAADGQLKEFIKTIGLIEQQVGHINQATAKGSNSLAQSHPIADALKELIQHIQDTLKTNIEVTSHAVSRGANSSSPLLKREVGIGQINKVKLLSSSADVMSARNSVLRVQVAKNRIKSVLTTSTELLVEKAIHSNIINHDTAIKWYIRLSNASILPGFDDNQEPKQFEHFPNVCQWFKLQIEQLRFPQNQNELKLLFEFIQTAKALKSAMEDHFKHTNQDEKSVQRKDKYNTSSRFISVYTNVINELEEILAPEIRLLNIDNNSQPLTDSINAKVRELVSPIKEGEDLRWQVDYTSTALPENAILFSSLALRSKLAINIKTALLKRFSGDPTQYNTKTSENVKNLIYAISNLLHSNTFSRNFKGMEEAYEHLFRTITCKSFDAKSVGAVSYEFVQSMGHYALQSKMLDEEGVSQLLQSIEAFIKQQKFSWGMWALAQTSCLLFGRPLSLFSVVAIPEIHEILSYNYHERFECNEYSVCCCDFNTATYYDTLYEDSDNKSYFHDGEMYTKKVLIGLLLLTPLSGAECATFCFQMSLCSNACLKAEPDVEQANSYNWINPASAINSCRIWCNQRSIGEVPLLADVHHEGSITVETLREVVNSRYH